MGHVHESAATLRLIGDELIPSEITGLLGAQPSEAQAKGDQCVGPNFGRLYVAKLGIWRLEAARCEPENLDGQIQELLGKVTNDLKVWAELGKPFRIDLFCGLFLQEGNEGLSLSPETLAALGQRGIKLDLDIYGP